MSEKKIHTYRVEYRFRRITRSGAKKKWSYNYKFQNSTDQHRAGEIIKTYVEGKIYEGYKKKGSFLEVHIRKVKEAK